jgi:hypothetical protein
LIKQAENYFVFKQAFLYNYATTKRVAYTFDCNSIGHINYLNKPNILTYKNSENTEQILQDMTQLKEFANN